MKPPPTTQTAFRLRDTQLAALRALARRGEMNVAQHVRTAIDEYLARSRAAASAARRVR